MTYVTGQPIIFVGCGQVNYKIATCTYYLVTDVPFNRLILTFVSYGYRMLCKHSWVISVTSRFIELCYFFPLDYVIYTSDACMFNYLFNLHFGEDWRIRAGVNLYETAYSMREKSRGSDALLTYFRERPQSVSVNNAQFLHLRLLAQHNNAHLSSSPSDQTTRPLQPIASKSKLKYQPYSTLNVKAVVSFWLLTKQTNIGRRNEKLFETNYL